MVYLPQDVQNVAIVQELLGAAPIFNPTYPLARIDLDRRAQIRVTGHYAPPDMVERYANQMSNGAHFPSPIITLDDVVVDGNTRLGAEKVILDLDSAPVLTLPFKWDEADDKLRAKITLVGQLANAQNGNPSTVEELQDTARRMLDLGYDENSIRVRVGLSQSDVRAIKRDMEVQRKLASAPVAQDTKEKFSTPKARKALAQACSLTAERFAQVADLAADADLGQKALKPLIETVFTAASDDVAKGLVESERRANAQRISDVRSGKSQPRVPGSSMLRRFSGVVRGKDPLALVEKNPAKYAEHMEVVTDLLDILTKVCAEQQKLIDAQGSQQQAA
jgi:hypothetical protein